MHDVAATCPHPGCARELLAADRTGPRLCGAGHAAGSCPSCGASHRLSANFCRRCRAPLRAEAAPQTLRERPPREAPECNLLRMQGSFRRPPVVWAGSAVAVSTSGRVECLPLVPGAGQVCLAEVPAAAGASRPALVEVQSLGTALPRAAGAAVLLLAHPAGVEAVVLATGAVLPLYRASGGAELVVNSAKNATGFSAVAASGAHFAVAARAGQGEVALLVGGFAEDAAPERAVTLRGTEVLGPVWAGGLFALATEEAAAVVDTASGESVTLPFPRGFAPMLARESGSPQVAAGSIPLCAGRTGGELWVTLAGRQEGLPGLLHLSAGANAPVFEPLGRGSSLTSNPDGSLCVAADDEVRVPGAGAARRARMQFGMPAVVSGGLLCTFGEELHRGLHSLRLEPERGGEAAEWIWEDAECHERSCAAPVLQNQGVQDGVVVVPYFAAEDAGNSGIRCAVWRVQGQNRVKAR